MTCRSKPREDNILSRARPHNMYRWPSHSIPGLRPPSTIKNAAESDLENHYFVQTGWEVSQVHEIEWLKFLLELSKLALAKKKGRKKDQKTKTVSFNFEILPIRKFGQKAFLIIFLSMHYVIGSFWLIITVDFIIQTYDITVHISRKGGIENKIENRLFSIR